MELTGRLVREKALQYPDQPNVDYDAEAAKLEGLPLAFEEGSWTWDDLEWIVSWKSKRALPEFKKNDIDHATEVIGETQAHRSAVMKVETLQDKLQGVGIPVASSILLFMDPSAYTVLDTNAWAVLHAAGCVTEEEPSTWNTGHYLQYLGACHALANELDVDLRTLDRALWVLGR